MATTFLKTFIKTALTDSTLKQKILEVQLKGTIEYNNECHCGVYPSCCFTLLLPTGILVYER